MIDIQVNKQRNGFTCGPCCCEAVLRFYGCTVPREWPTSAVEGTHPHSLAAILRKRGINVMIGSCTREVLAAHVRNGNPAIVLLQYGLDSHFCVVNGFEGGYIHFQCPVEGQRKLTPNKFLAEWWADGDTPMEFLQFAILCWK